MKRTSNKKNFLPNITKADVVGLQEVKDIPKPTPPPPAPKKKVVKTTTATTPRKKRDNSYKKKKETLEKKGRKPYTIDVDKDFMSLIASVAKFEGISVPEAYEKFAQYYIEENYAGLYNTYMKKLEDRKK